MALGIQLKADPGDEFDLGFQKVDVLFFVMDEAFKQIPRHVILDRMAMGRGFGIEGVRRQLGLQVVIEYGLPRSFRYRETPASAY
jgi:hypothetical protein